VKATDLLEKDHRAVEALFEDFEEAGERAFQRKRVLVEQIVQELDVHARIEEEIFYPAVKGARSEDARDIVREALEEHHAIKTLVEELAEMEPSDEQFDSKVKVLRENVEHHVEEEEGEMFPEAKRLLGGDRLDEIGRQLELRKEELRREAVRT
jgi:hemerythrin superfamily protein